MSAANVKILLIDDEPAILRFVRAGLAASGHTVISAASAALGLSQERAFQPDIIILDLHLPDMEGMEVIRQLRTAGILTPIIVLSSRDDERTKVQALDLGADDYLSKPFGMDELRARIRTALRHRLQLEGETMISHIGDLSVDLVRRVVMVRDSRISLSPREYELLRLLVKYAGKVLTHKFIQQQIWGYEIGVQYVRIYIRALRLKIETTPDMPFYILTENGVGYRLRELD